MTRRSCRIAAEGYAATTGREAAETHPGEEHREREQHRDDPGERDERGTSGERRSPTIGAIPMPTRIAVEFQGRTIPGAAGSIETSRACTGTTTANAVTSPRRLPARRLVNRLSGR